MPREIQPTVYSKRSRPACVVLVDGHWYSGEVRARRFTPDGTLIEVAYYTDPDTAFLREFSAAEVRTLTESQDSDWD